MIRCAHPDARIASFSCKFGPAICAQRSGCVRVRGTVPTLHHQKRSRSSSEKHGAASQDARASASTAAPLMGERLCLVRLRPFHVGERRRVEESSLGRPPARPCGYPSLHAGPIESDPRRRFRQDDEATLQLPSTWPLRPISSIRSIGNPLIPIYIFGASITMSRKSRIAPR